MRIYDEENFYDTDDDDMAGYTLVEEHSIYKPIVPEKDPETIASPIPENEQTVILCEPKVTLIQDGAELAVKFTPDDGCEIFSGEKKAGSLKPAYVKKLKAERGGQKVKAYFKKSVPPMVRLVFTKSKGVKIPSEQ